MKVLFLSAFVVTLLLAFLGQELRGSSTGQGQDALSSDLSSAFCENFYCPGSKKGKRPPGKKQPGKKQPGKKTGGKKQPGKKPQSKHPTVAEQRKKAEEQRKKEEAARQKKLQADHNRRNAVRLTNVKTVMAEKMGSLTKLTWRIEAIGQKRKKLGKALDLVTSKAKEEFVPGMMERLKRMETESEKYVGAATVLTNELNKLKTTCSKWNGSSGKGGKTVPAAAALVKMEEDVLGIKRDFARVEFELNKAEVFFQNATKSLFFCVSELVRVDVNFTAEEKDSVRSLDRPE
jgi:hypothetical protein